MEEILKIPKKNQRMDSNVYDIVPRVLNNLIVCNFKCQKRDIDLFEFTDLIRENLRNSSLRFKNNLLFFNLLILRLSSNLYLRYD